LLPGGKARWRWSAQVLNKISMIIQRITVRRVLKSLVAAGLISSQLAYAQVTLNFVNADIDQVARAIGAATGRTIIVDPRVKGQLNLVSENAVGQEEALKTLQSALRMQGFTLVEDHGVLKVIPEADAKLQGVPTFVGNRPVARGDQVITQVFQLRYESANNVLPVLRPLISPNNAIAAYAANNTLVVTDYADNVRRVASIIAGLDVPQGQAADIVVIRHANALDLAAQLQKLLDPGAIGNSDATLKVTVMADPRTNSLLLRASNASRLAAAHALINRLDVATKEPGNIHVVPLRNAVATQLARTLRGMMGQNTGSSGGQGSGSGTSSSLMEGSSAGGQNGGSSGLPPLPGTGSSGSSGSGIGGSASGSGGFGGGSGGSSGQSALPGRNGEDNEQGGGMIQADAATNSLIITAPDAVYSNLRRVIDQLDARRAQVYIESLILEVSTTKTAQLGIQWQGLLGSTNRGVYGGTNFTSGGVAGTNILNLTAGLAAAQTSASSLVLPTNGLNIGVFSSKVGLGALLQALAGNTDVNVLSTPNMMTLDNEEARIIVGQNVPIQTGSYATTGTTSTVTPYSTYDRQDVGITLHVKPQITEGGIIKMQLYQEDSSVVSGSDTNPGGVSINKRAIQSTVLADDGQTIVLGGLIQDQYNNGNSKVPLLGDIPWIGNLFRYENKNRSKTNLMIFLRPVIVRDGDQSRRISLDRYDYMRVQDQNYQSDNRVILDTDRPRFPEPTGPASTAVPASVFAPLPAGNAPPDMTGQPAVAAPPPDNSGTSSGAAPGQTTGDQP
jgi:general secretion pathway protein D